MVSVQRLRTAARSSGSWFNQVTHSGFVLHVALRESETRIALCLLSISGWRRPKLLSNHFSRHDHMLTRHRFSHDTLPIKIDSLELEVLM